MKGKKMDPGQFATYDVKNGCFSVFCVCFFFANNAFNSPGATEVLDVISCFSQDVTLNTDAVGAVLAGKGRGCLSWTTVRAPFLTVRGSKQSSFSRLNLTW